jgi:hypothetical protein
MEGLLADQHEKVLDKNPPKRKNWILKLRETLMLLGV